MIVEVCECRLSLSDIIEREVQQLDEGAPVNSSLDSKGSVIHAGMAPCVPLHVFRVRAGSQLRHVEWVNDDPYIETFMSNSKGFLDCRFTRKH